jgi:hypothetical protein
VLRTTEGVTVGNYVTAGVGNYVGSGSNFVMLVVRVLHMLLVFRA